MRKLELDVDDYSRGAISEIGDAIEQLQRAAAAANKVDGDRGVAARRALAMAHARLEEAEMWLGKVLEAVE